jgi:hypothetical protein
VLGAHQEHVGRRLGARGGDRFAGVAWRATSDGCVLIEGAAAWFDCTIEQQVRSGDHDIVVVPRPRPGRRRGGRPARLPRERVPEAGIAAAEDVG